MSSEPPAAARAEAEDLEAPPPAADSATASTSAERPCCYVCLVSTPRHAASAGAGGGWAGGIARLDARKPGPPRPARSPAPRRKRGRRSARSSSWSRASAHAHTWCIESASRGMRASTGARAAVFATRPSRSRTTCRRACPASPRSPRHPASPTGLPRGTVSALSLPRRASSWQLGRCSVLTRPPSRRYLRAASTYQLASCAPGARNRAGSPAARSWLSQSPVQSHAPAGPPAREPARPPANRVGRQLRERRAPSAPTGFCFWLFNAFIDGAWGINFAFGEDACLLIGGVVICCGLTLWRNALKHQPASLGERVLLSLPDASGKRAPILRLPVHAPDACPPQPPAARAAALTESISVAVVANAVALPSAAATVPTPTEQRRARTVLLLHGGRIAAVDRPSNARGNALSTNAAPPAERCAPNRAAPACARRPAPHPPATAPRRSLITKFTWAADSPFAGRVTVAVPLAPLGAVAADEARCAQRPTPTAGAASVLSREWRGT